MRLDLANAPIQSIAATAASVLSKLVAGVGTPAPVGAGASQRGPERSAKSPMAEDWHVRKSRRNLVSMRISQLDKHGSGRGEKSAPSSMGPMLQNLLSPLVSTGRLQVRILFGEPKRLVLRICRFMGDPSSTLVPLVTVVCGVWAMLSTGDSGARPLRRND